MGCVIVSKMIMRMMAMMSATIGCVIASKMITRRMVAMMSATVWAESL